MSKRPKSEEIKIRVDQDIRDQYEMMARLEDLSLSDVVRRALRLYLAQATGLKPAA